MRDNDGFLGPNGTDIRRIQQNSLRYKSLTHNFGAIYGLCLFLLSGNIGLLKGSFVNSCIFKNEKS